jgi:hypothetical protein
MLAMTSINDGVPILPGSWIEWREFIEYTTSVALAFGTGDMLGQHVGEEQFRRRPRMIQDVVRAARPLAGVTVTAVGSIHAGLKGVLGH